MNELRVAIRMIASLFGLAVALQAVAKIVEELRDLTGTKRDAREHPRFQRIAARPPIEKIVGQRKAIGRAVLAKQVREAHTVHGYTLAEIANHLGVHYATAGRLLKLADDDAK